MPLFLLRAAQLGYVGQALEYVTVGMLFDMMCESGNDGVKYDTIATQEDFDSF